MIQTKMSENGKRKLGARQSVVLDTSKKLGSVPETVLQSLFEGLDWDIWQ